jgi:ribosomal protein S18 acetylase RimI-like enzyme
MTPTPAELWERGAATLVESWGQYARAAVGASVERHPGVAVALFPGEPERGVYNTALFDRGLRPRDRTAAIEALQSAYAAAGVTRFAAWAHEDDADLCGELERRGFTVDTATRAMAASLDRIAVPRPRIELAPADWSDYLTILGAPAGLQERADPGSFHVLIGCLDGRKVATAMAFDHDGDCGIYNVTTLPDARRRGLGTALTAMQLYDARGRGCTTASLQSTTMAERVYTAAGFTDLGRIVEYAPP